MGRVGVMYLLEEFTHIMDNIPVEITMDIGHPIWYNVV